MDLSSDRNRRNIRQSIIVVLSLQVFALAWLMVGRSKGHPDAEVDFLVLFVASANTVMLGWLLLSRPVRSLLRGLELLCVGSLITTVVSFALIDYGELRTLGSLPLTVPAVAIVLALMGIRRRL